MIKQSLISCLFMSTLVYSFNGLAMHYDTPEAIELGTIAPHHDVRSPRPPRIRKPDAAPPGVEASPSFLHRTLRREQDREERSSSYRQRNTCRLAAIFGLSALVFTIPVAYIVYTVLSSGEKDPHSSPAKGESFGLSDALTVTSTLFSTAGTTAGAALYTVMKRRELTQDLTTAEEEAMSTFAALFVEPDEGLTTFPEDNVLTSLFDETTASDLLTTALSTEGPAAKIYTTRSVSYGEENTDETTVENPSTSWGFLDLDLPLNTSGEEEGEMTTSLTSLLLSAETTQQEETTPLGEEGLTSMTFPAAESPTTVREETQTSQEITTESGETSETLSSGEGEGQTTALDNTSPLMISPTPSCTESHVLPNGQIVSRHPYREWVLTTDPYLLNATRSALPFSNAAQEERAYLFYELLDTRDAPEPIPEIADDNRLDGLEGGLPQDAFPTLSAAYLRLEHLAHRLNATLNLRPTWTSYNHQLEALKPTLYSIQNPLVGRYLEEVCSSGEAL